MRNLKPKPKIISQSNTQLGPDAIDQLLGADSHSVDLMLIAAVGLTGYCFGS